MLRNVKTRLLAVSSFPEHVRNIPVEGGGSIFQNHLKQLFFGDILMIFLLYQLRKMEVSSSTEENFDFWI